MTALADTDYSRARISFYDVECLEDAFTVTFIEPKIREVRIFGLLNPRAVSLDTQHPLYGSVIDRGRLARRLWDENPAIHDWDGSGQHFSVEYHDLATIEGNQELASYFGAFVPTQEWIEQNRKTWGRSWGVIRPDAPNRYEISGMPTELIRPVCDIHPEYDPENLHPFFIGYNSKNYDTSMLAIYINFAFHCLTSQENFEVNGGWGDPSNPLNERVFTPVDTAMLRRYSEELFSNRFIDRMPRALVESELITQGDPDWESIPHLIRKSMLETGRHVDMSELNEANRMIALKRQGVTIGRKVKESDKLGNHAKLTDLEDYYELCSYNLSDVILNARLFEYDEYNSQFDLKLSLMRTFPGTIFDRASKNTYEPVEDPYHVKSFRATPDTTSAQFVAAILCPYDRLEDLESVSYLYPHPRIAEERGVEPIDVLDEVVGFFRERMAISEDDDDRTVTQKQAALEEIEHVYAFYDSIRGRNFNESTAWLDDYGNQVPGVPRKGHPAGLEPMRPGDLSEPHLMVPYYLPDGTPTSCYVNFSIGGIHGDQYRDDLVMQRHNNERRVVLDQWVAAQLFPTPREYVDQALAQHDLVEIVTDDGDVHHVDRRRVITGATEDKVKWKAPSKSDASQVAELELAQSAFGSPWEFAQAARPTSRRWNVHVGRLQLSGSNVLGRKQQKDPRFKNPQAMEILRTIPLPDQWQTTGADELIAALPRPVLRACGIDPDMVPLPFDYKPDTREGRSAFVVSPSAQTMAKHPPAQFDTLPPHRRRLSLRAGEVIDERATLPMKINSIRAGATSVGRVIHEDFTSYYPNMLRNMQAFYNERQGVDLYAQILADKDRYDVLKKKAQAEGDHKAADRWNLLRNGTKLILNSASGAGDTSYDTSIRMNNRIVSMRIIGQLFTWWIGQAQTFGVDEHHALIPSTNTDGIYSVMADEGVNNAILAKESERIGVEIEPETLFMASKDSNGRLELIEDSKVDPALPLEQRLRIVGAGGASLAAHKGPRVDKRLNHAVISDWTLAQYLTRIVADTHETPQGREPLRIDQPCDQAFVTELIASKRDERTVEALMFFQNILASSRSSYSYPAVFPFLDQGDPKQGLNLDQPMSIQHINRIFAVRPGTAGAVGAMRAVGKAVGVKEQARRVEKRLPVRVIDPNAERVFALNGIGVYTAQVSSFDTVVPSQRDVKMETVTSLPSTQPIIIDNRDLHCLSQAELDAVFDNLDLEFYAQSVISHFDENWRNPPIERP